MQQRTRFDDGGVDANPNRHATVTVPAESSEAFAMSSASPTPRVNGLAQRTRVQQRFGSVDAELNNRSPTREEMEGAAELLTIMSNLRVKDRDVEMPGLQGDFFPVPPALAEFLIALLGRVASGEVVPFPPEDPLISTKQAANIIGFTYLEMDEKLANGDLPFEPNGPDRLLVRAEVVEYDRQCTASELEALQEMIRAAEECGAYDL